MFILARKTPLMVLFYFHIFNHTITLAQPGFIYHICENAANYTRNSTYQRNLDTTLSALPTTNPGFGFYNRSTGQGNNRVNSIALCRGDLEPDVCRACVNDSIVRLREICPNQKEAVGYYDNCLLKYSNETILGNTQIKFYMFYYNDGIAPDNDRFNGALRPLLDKLIANAAAGGSLRKFATGNTPGLDSTTIYGLVQCTPDLSKLQCSNCLKNAIDQFVRLYSGRIGGRALAPMCNFRYEINRFFNGNTLAILPPPSSSPQPPIFQPSPPVTPPPAGTLKGKFVFAVQRVIKRSPAGCGG